jgi:hypothetical protein
MTCSMMPASTVFTFPVATAQLDFCQDFG